MSIGINLELVRRALQMPLPGAAAQSRMSPRPRSTPGEFQHMAPPRQGGVLILLYPQAGRLFLPLTRRTEHVAHHKGQVALPGGAREPGDPTLWHTALREAQEEIGLDPALVEFLGILTPLEIPVSNFQIYPHVGYLSFRPPFSPDPIEVAELIEMPLETLLDPATHVEETWLWRGRMMQVPFYRYREHVIWGATAMVLSELEVALSAAGPPNP